jgi:hypothetical protein
LLFWRRHDVNTRDESEEIPVAWTAILESTPVHVEDGSTVGVVNEVLGAEDIFHGLVVRSGPLGADKMVPADRVATITNRRVVVDMTEDELRGLPPYQQEEAFTLGIVGLFKKRLGWVEGKDEPG